MDDIWYLLRKTQQLCGFEAKKGFDFSGISKYNTITFLKGRLRLQSTEAGSKSSGKRHKRIYFVFA